MIHGSSSDADLLRFAWVLARAGAASIVLDGTIDWLSPNDESIRSPEFQFCAGQWLLQHVNLDPMRAAGATTTERIAGWNCPEKRGAGPAECGWTSDKQERPNRITQTGC